jgi:hypothetical protein
MSVNEGRREIERSPNRNILSAIQIEITLNRRGGWSYQKLREKDTHWSDKAAITCVTPTAYGYVWMSLRSRGWAAQLSFQY